MIILLLLFILIAFFLHSKIKLEIFFSSVGLDYHFNVSIIYFKRVKTFYKKEIQVFLEENKNKKMKLSLKEVKEILEYLSFETVTVDVQSGLIEVLPTIFSVPIIATFLSVIYSILNVQNPSFSVKPVYNQLHFSSKIHVLFSIKIFNLIYLIFKILLGRIQKNKSQKVLDRN